MASAETSFMGATGFGGQQGNVTQSTGSNVVSAAFFSGAMAAPVDPLTPMSVAVTAKNAADTLSGAKWTQGFNGSLTTSFNGQTYNATPSADGNGYTITTPTVFAQNTIDGNYPNKSDAGQTQSISQTVAKNISIAADKAEDLYQSIVPANAKQKVEIGAAAFYGIGGAINGRAGSKPKCNIL